MPPPPSALTMVKDIAFSVRNIFAKIRKRKNDKINSRIVGGSFPVAIKHES